MVVFHLPAPGELELLVREHVEEGDQVTVVLIALEVVSVPPHLTDHVLQAGVARKHAIGTLDRDSEMSFCYTFPGDKRARARVCVGLTGFECSTVKKSGLHRNLALGDCRSSERRERPPE